MQVNKKLSEVQLRKRPRLSGDLYNQFLTILRNSPFTLNSLSSKCGVNDDTMGLWGIKTDARIGNFEAALNALGYKLKIERIDQ